ncbi:hypothetical protein PAEPH01_0751 [Pancytospora epiphaga]|nr:hypothetical protein PAEPH01_0751 [Pancytospora epiphaga]
MSEQELDQETYSDLEEIKNTIIDDIPEVETLEVIYGSIQLTHSVDGPTDPESFMKYARYDQNDDSIDVNEYATDYLGVKWSFCRVYAGNDNYKAFLLLSKNELDGEKKGMVVAVDSSNMMVVATCKADSLRKVNSELAARMDECY